MIKHTNSVKCLKGGPASKSLNQALQSTFPTPTHYLGGGGLGTPGLGQLDGEFCLGDFIPGEVLRGTPASGVSRGPIAPHLGACGDPLRKFLLPPLLCFFGGGLKMVGVSLAWPPSHMLSPYHWCLPRASHHCPQPLQPDADRPHCCLTAL